MFRIRKKIRFEMAHRLRKCWSKQCKNLHGHSYVAEIILSAYKLNDDGMVMDFGELKALLRDVFEELDHSVILNKEDQLINAMREGNAKTIIVSYNPTAENMAYDLVMAMEKNLPINIINVKVRLHETESGWAEFEFDRTESLRARGIEVENEVQG